jgi:transcription initiation factor IIE alpha subunit
MEIVEIYKAAVICHKAGLCDGYKAGEEIKHLRDKADEFDQLMKPHKPTPYPNGYFNCPNCKSTIEDEVAWKKLEHCTSCGQKLDWIESEGE